MQTRTWPNFFALILAVCLLIGMAGNLTGRLGGGIFIVTLLCALNVRLIGPRLARITDSQLKIILISGMALMMIVQIMIVHFMPVTVYHDPYRVLAQADQMASGRSVWNITYFWRYVNNVPLAYLLSLWLRLMNGLGASSNLAIHLLSLLTLDTDIALTLITVRQLSHKNELILGAFAFFALTPFAYTYYLQVFYSDLPLQLFMLIILRIVRRWSTLTRRQRLISGCGLVLTSLLAMLIKANVIVILPAMLIVVWVSRHGAMGHKLMGLVPVVLITLGFTLSVPATAVIKQAAHYTPQTSYEFPTSSWILMGLNVKSNGMYSGKDTGRQVRMPSKQARQRYNGGAIQQRMQQLGFTGLLHLWLVKIGVLLNVHGIQDWYNGGFSAAPAWYQQHEQGLRLTTTISYTVAVLTLWATICWRILAWRPDWHQPQDVAVLLAIMTALGFLAFHALLWEAEARYGQVLIPLSWFILAGIPVRVRQPVTKRQWVMPLSVIATLASLLTVATVIGDKNPVTTVAAAQRSQLSTQYHAKPLTIRPGTVMTQEVPVHGAANYFSVQVYRGSKVHATLQNITSGRRYVLHATASVYNTHARLTAGNYRISICNLTTSNQRVAVVHTANYRLAPEPLVQNNMVRRTSSFIYLFVNHPQEATS